MSQEKPVVKPSKEKASPDAENAIQRILQLVEQRNDILRQRQKGEKSIDQKEALTKQAIDKTFSGVEYNGEKDQITVAKEADSIIGLMVNNIDLKEFVEWKVPSSGSKRSKFWTQQGVSYSPAFEKLNEEIKKRNKETKNMFYINYNAEIECARNIQFCIELNNHKIDAATKSRGYIRRVETEYRGGEAVPIHKTYYRNPNEEGRNVIVTRTAAYTGRKLFFDGDRYRRKNNTSLFEKTLKFLEQRQAIKDFLGGVFDHARISPSSTRGGRSLP